MTIAIKPTASGSTIEQDGSAILTVDGSGNIDVANNLTVTGTAPIPDALSTATGSAPSYSARAWINFDMTTATIRGSGNISSITDGGVGKFTITMSTAMPDTNYNVVVTGADDSTSQIGICTGNNSFLPSYTTSSFRILASNYSSSNQDKDHVHCSVFR
jgi:hypothetical protein